MIGQRFGRLSVQAKAHRATWKTCNSEWHCLCDCGSRCQVQHSNLLYGHTKSCGCLAKELYGCNNRKHGMHTSPEYAAWENMKQRCTNPCNSQFQNYGARGIAVCSEWTNSFEAFYDRLGPRPSSMHSLDRIDVNGHYEPGNVRWATPVQQSRNKRNNTLVWYEDAMLPIAEAAERAGISAKTISARLRRGWNGSRLFDRPKSKANAEAGE